ncbi:cation:proton antiporter family protein [Halochromatium glycolicum]|uniref:Potassium transporter Kef n=1 Tax=Halochromatium glycolicum TaxID=85075 RepID=A0AAJ0U1F7_9GAMM|nr:cation:proton antiporter family protein [Halochromatium glycolicum]MBK1703397.1 potassium transporter Kef [Halochromatium glycolicum]
MFDIVWIAVAFALGLGARQIGLPPLVGYLVAGFVLHAFGARESALLEEVADIGITLLLFTIGLKLKIKSLAQPHVWGTATLHMFAMLAFAVPLLLALGGLGVPLLAGVDFQTAALLAFALSFSSTVFAVKVLEEKGEMGSLYGTIAIGILIIQDVAAVLFLAFSAGKVPTVWALLLLLLIPARRGLLWLMSRVGHGELLLLFGLTLAMGTSELFEIVHMKGDLGAILIGVMVANHPKASELAKSLLDLKDLLLVGFFLSIGLHGAPSPGMVLFAALLLIALPYKWYLFQTLMLWFGVRGRTAFLGGLTLANYSEFGLIVTAIGVENGWLDPRWLAIVALALAFSFIAAAPASSRSHSWYERISEWLRARERKRRLAEEAEIDPGDANAMVVGMGRIGSGAYDELAHERGLRPVGVDADPDTIARHQTQGRYVVQGSATDADFWHRLHLDDGHMRLVLLAMPQVSENLFAAEHLIKEGFTGTIGAIAKYPEDEQALRAAGVQLVFNLYAEAGAGFAQHVCAESHSVPAAMPASVASS